VVACHEAGHAIIASVLPGVDPVQKISIVQRGVEVLGHTLQLPDEEHHLTTRQSLLNQLAVLLGGRAAEEIAFQEISTGAQNDVLRATDLARSMVTEFGMSDSLGPVSYRRRNARFLDVSGTPAEPLAEETAREIDLEVKSLVVDAHTRAQSILTQHRAILDVLTHQLMEREVVEGAEIRALVQRAAPSGADRASRGLRKIMSRGMRPISLERAQAAKKAALQRFKKLPSLTGVGITRVGGGYAIKLNLREPIEPGVTFPADIDGVPLCVEITCTIRSPEVRLPPRVS
jgi:hypothetical protein